jgi:hypothetical protein
LGSEFCWYTELDSKVGLWAASKRRKSLEAAGLDGEVLLGVLIWADLKFPGREAVKVRILSERLVF